MEDEIIKIMAFVSLFILSVGFVLMAWSDQKTAEFIRDLERKRLDDIYNEKIKLLESYYSIKPFSFPRNIERDEKLNKIIRGEQEK